MSWAKEVSDAIRTLWIPHPKFQQAEARTLAALLTADPGEILLVVGASRVGKSSLVDRLSTTLVEHMRPDGSMPFVSMILENNSTYGSLSTKTFTESGLIAVRHPMFGVDGPDDPWGINRTQRIHRTSEGTLRTAFENALVHRGTKYFCIDEAHHLKYAKGGIDAAKALLESLKCLAAKANVVLILVGSYPLLRLVHQLPHLIGRKLQISFDRYRADDPNDVLNFDRILLEYSAHLRLEVDSLRCWNQYLYQGSLGCLGALRGWIRDALNEAWVSNSPVLTKRHFELSIKSDLELREMASEIEAGESSLASGQLIPEQQPGLAEVALKQVRKRHSKPFTAAPRRFGVGERRNTDGK